MARTIAFSLSFISPSFLAKYTIMRSKIKWCAHLYFREFCAGVLLVYECICGKVHTPSANTLQHPERHCNPPQHTSTLCTSLQHNTAASCDTCNTLQHTATHCNTLQHTATHSRIGTTPPVQQASLNADGVCGSHV